MIDWNRLSPHQFEDMCSVLISRLHPDARRIDGAGGDGGRDVQISTPAGPIIFEMKSFTGRLDGGRRRQIAHSLQRASAYEPAAWRLVVPIDPTPAEERWFGDLGSAYSFSCEWLGLTWLDDKMAGHPDIERYYLHDSNATILEILRELNHEQGALDRGVPDAIERMEVLARRLNELDPHYAFGISIEKDSSKSVTVWPKYAGAEHDRPIKINAVFQFPDDEEGRRAVQAFQDSLDYGTPNTIQSEYINDITLDLPGGLSESLGGGEFKIGLSTSQARSTFTAQFRILDANGRTRAQIPLKASVENLGGRGGDATLIDATGAIVGNLRVDMLSARGTVQFKYDPPDDILPGNLLAVLQFLEQYRPPHSMIILIDGKETTSPLPIDEPLSEDLSRSISVVRALDEIQRTTGVYFPMPDRLSEEEVTGIFVAKRLLAGDTVRGTWTTLKMVSTVGAMPSLESTLSRGGDQLMSEEELRVKVSGYEIPLGYSRRIMPHAIVAELPELNGDEDSDAPVEIVFRAGGDNSMTTVLISADERHRTD
jgi:hypothetical protein